MALSANIDTDIWLQYAWRNRLQTLILLAVMEGFLALLGWLVWGPVGIVVLIMMGLAGTLFTPTISPWVLLRMYHAVPVDLAQIPFLDKVVVELTELAKLPQVPRLYYVPSQVLNAFTVGSSQQASIVLTDGLLRQLTVRELAGVLAHEMSHIRSNDLRVMGLADLFSRMTSILSMTGQLLLLFNLPLMMFGEQVISWLVIVLLIFAPTVSVLTQLALSRTREFDADLNAVRLTGDPDGLACALAKIEQIQGSWLERVFMPNRHSPYPSMLRTHPEMEQRIQRLMALKPHLHTAHSPRLDALLHDLQPLPHKPVRRRPKWHITGLWH